jgi:hypothetical protein
LCTVPYTRYLYRYSLSQALICQQVYHQPFHSSLVHFLAALGVHAETGRLRTAVQFPSTLSSLIYCVRALSAELCLPASRRAEQGAAETLSFLQHRTRFLVDGSYSPMSVMLSLLSYAKFISLRTPGSVAGSMWWSTDRQTFYLKGRPIQLHLLRRWRKR